MNIAREFGNIIKNGTTVNHKKVFVRDFKKYSSGTNTDDTATEIRLLNKFWHKRLIDVPGTFDIRSWIEDTVDEEAYVSAFKEHWFVYITNHEHKDLIIMGKVNE